MEYVRFGGTGLEVSRICFGCMSFGNPGSNRPWILKEDEARPIFRKAWESGINFYDTANVYAAGSSEEITGRQLKELGPRDSYVLATKVFNRMRPGPNGAGLSRKAIFAELDASLKRLDTDYIDLYQVHRWDYFTSIEETLEALNDAVKAGKIRYIGASSMYAWQFAKALFTSKNHGWAQYISMQNQLSLLMREEEREMLPLCADQNIAVMPWSPLGGGLLTRPWASKTKRGDSDPALKRVLDATETGSRAIVAAVEKLAGKRGVPMAQIAMAWILNKNEVTSPIIGATKVRHIEDAVASVAIKLSPEEIETLETAYRALPSPAYLTEKEIVARGRLPGQAH